MGIGEIPKWLKELPLAPEFHPSDTEFADPIAYISKIEKEASAFGICKIIPPLPKPSKKYVFSNLNKSLVKCLELAGDVDGSKVRSLLKLGSSTDMDARAVFTTRQQELGQDNKKMKVGSDIPRVAVQKQVWQSGEIYTIEQFESKAKTFARSILGVTKEVSPLVLESLFWKATSEKPIYIEYANDVPGSAFGEPEDQFKYFCHSRRRRKRTSYRRKENSDHKNNAVSAAKDLAVNDIKDISVESDYNATTETSKPFTIVNVAPDANCPGSKNGNACSSVEGTAGWKLSNSPWNLQVIARSPGSLTRFMPDDIPGVTSPMVYIGMLFSWFAWHVEDHELHSMNFLHTGSPKTWYAVPGDYAFDFEELIRTEAYGGNIDRLAVLSLLGEKTTLLSPELVIAYGIPCCRLIQNPGEFVVTFPRAYHVGFSHGFNCGEAANFGTPQWLKVAKEAAVRRAAMNYLPMLSHQQLLYLLTMSFVSRVPRYLLPGARSSRLRDRLKEERELLVKKAFIEDMLHENKLLSFLLGRQSRYRAVLWHPDSLPCMGKDSELLNRMETISMTRQELASNSDPENSSNRSSLLDEMSLYMEKLNDLYSYDVDDDILCDFQVDSGTLACVACGILGYPFLAVVQPCGSSLMGIQPSSDISCQGRGNTDHKDYQLSDYDSGVNINSEGYAGVLLPGDAPLFDQGWNTSIKFLRPRVFCLEHAVQTEDVLKTKGGVRVMVICHSDYQKIKAHASAVAEEIGINFNCEDLTLDPASQEDLNLINLSIDDEDDYGEDWTTDLGFNLRHCVKVRKTSTFKQVQHALPLEGLFHYKSCDSNFDIKWLRKRHRSRVKLHHPHNLGHCTNVDSKIGLESSRTDDSITRKEHKLIQYSRRKKLNPNDSTGASRSHDRMTDQSRTIEASTNELLYDRCQNTSNKVGNSELGKGKSDSCAGGVTELKCEVLVIETSRSTGSNSSPSRVAVLPASDTLLVEDLEKIESQTVKEFYRGGEITGTRKFSRNIVTLSDSASFAAIPLIEDFDAQRDDVVMGASCTVERVTGIGGPTNVMQPATAQCNIGESISHEDEAVSKRSHAFSLEIHDNLENIHAADGLSSSLSLRYSARRNTVELVPSSMTPVDQPAFLTATENPEVPDELCAGVGLYDSATLDNEASLTEIQNSAIQDVLSCSTVLKAVDISSTVSREECSEVAKNSFSEDVHNDVALCVEPTTPIHGAKEMDGDEVIYDSDLKIVKGSTSPLLEALPAAPKESFAEAKLSASATGDNRNSTKEVNEESCSRCADLSNTVPVEENNRIQLEISTKFSPDDGSDSLLQYELPKGVKSTMTNCAYMKNGRKRMRQEEQEAEQKTGNGGFIRSPCEGLRPRVQREGANKVDVSRTALERSVKSDIKVNSVSSQPKKATRKGYHRCDIDGCRMSFGTKEELRLHKRNRCPQDDCRKKFRSHKYAVLHQRVHDDDRPLKCPWKGCTMSFKWAWARTEHIRVHTGERPYKCKVEGCGLSFRFVSDFSRHRRKTGHYVNLQPESSHDSESICVTVT